jgi:hypothetical protein
MYAGISPDVELALCAHLLVPDMPESALAQVWAEHRVLATDVNDRGGAALPLENLAVRVGNKVYRCAKCTCCLLPCGVASALGSRCFRQ